MLLPHTWRAGWLILALFVPVNGYAQAEGFLDDVLSGQHSDEWVTDWKGFLELAPRRYVRDTGIGPWTDDQFIVHSEFEADISINRRLTGYIRPRLYADIGSDSFHRWHLPDAYLTYAVDEWDVRAGVFVENWGIADTFNPIDVLNTRDFATEFLDPLKLGQPGFRIRRLFSGSDRIGEPTLSFYWMPTFVHPRYAPQGQRLAPTQPGSTFDSAGTTKPGGSDEAFWGLRYQSTLKTAAFNTDVQAVAARGPDRTPIIHKISPNRTAPLYPSVDTLGVGFRAVPNAARFGHFLSTLTLKGEVVRRSFRRISSSPFEARNRYWSYVVGIDKEWPNLFRDQDELAITLEFVSDSESDAVSNRRLFQHDLVMRVLWQANNFGRTALQLRGVIDPTDEETIMEATFATQLRSVSEDLQLELRYQYFDYQQGRETLLSQLPNNSAFTIGLRWVFAK